MARVKKPVVSYKDAVYYHASESSHLGSAEEIYPDETQTGAIQYLREQEGDVDTIYLFEIKCVGKYKVNFQLEKLD